MAKPRMGPVPKKPKKAAETIVVTCVSMIVRKALSKPASTAAAEDLPLRISSLMRSKTRTFESTPMPMVRMTPAMPGRVSTAPDMARKARRIMRLRIKASTALPHEKHHHEEAQYGSLHAVTDRVCPKGGANGALFEIANRRRKCSSAKDDCQFMRALLAEIPFNHSGIVDATVDDGIRFDAMIEDDGHVAAEIRLGEGPK